MLHDQGFPASGMKFTKEQGQIYHDNDWIARVGYDEYEEEQPETQNNNHNNEDYSDDDNDDDNDGNEYGGQQQELAEILPHSCLAAFEDGEVNKMCLLSLSLSNSINQSLNRSQLISISINRCRSRV